MKKLLVISEPYLDINNGGTRNNALNTIIEAYTKYFEKVICIVPSNNQNQETFDNNKVRYYSVNGYEKSLNKRISFLFSRKDSEKRLLQIISVEKPDLIQIRIPSIFTQLLFPVIRKLDIPITSYIAGEWDEALKLNYSKVPSIGIISRLLFKCQGKIIAQTIPVCTGDKLRMRVKKYNSEAYAYYSTTHKSIHKRVLSDKFYNLVIIGRLEKLKRVEDAIMTLFFLRKESHNYNLSIIGDGVEKDKLISLVDKLNLSDSVYFYGQINNKIELQNILLEKDILIHTSLSEGTSKVLPEAMSYGILPIAVRNVGSNNNILSEGRGILVNPKSPQEIADEIIKFNNTSSENRNMYIYNGYKYAEEHSIEKELDKMWNFIFERV